MLTLELKQKDRQVFQILHREDMRQESGLELIASENFVSRAVLEACSSTLTNKYAEGYPGRRWYNGCAQADEIELLAQERLKKLFGAQFANVQPHSGAQANQAVFYGYLRPGDTILGMDLNHGGHLTHGSTVNFSGRDYRVLSYGVSPKDHRIDFDQLYALARRERPRLIIAGFSAYPRVLPFERFKEIASEVNAFLMADIAHISGLIAAQEHPSPVGIAEIITSTTHKTLRGPRGGFILTNSKEDNKKINSAVFPGTQGGPLMHVIAAKAVAFGEALDEQFKNYIKMVKENAKTLAATFMQRGFKVVSNGTDNHLVLLDVGSKGVSGAAAADTLEKAGITANKNTIPFDTRPPTIASGVRFGSPALTTRGLRSAEFKLIGDLICDILSDMENEVTIEKVKNRVLELTESFPMERFRLHQLDTDSSQNSHIPVSLRDISQKSFAS